MEIRTENTLLFYVIIHKHNTLILYKHKKRKNENNTSNIVYPKNVFKRYLPIIYARAVLLAVYIPINHKKKKYIIIICVRKKTCDVIWNDAAKYSKKQRTRPSCFSRCYKQNKTYYLNNDNGRTYRRCTWILVS